MKAFLMFRDRDFDPQQILMLREKKPRQLETDERLSLQQFLPWNEKALTQDLGLDILINSMADGDNFLSEAAKVAVLTSVTDIDTILYRQQVLSDCMKYETVVRNIYMMAIDTIESDKNKHWWSLHSSPSGTLYEAVNKLEMFAEMLRKLRNIADQNEESFNSEGFKRLFGMLRKELNDEYLSSIDEHLKGLKFTDGVVISAELGRGNKGSNYILNKPYEDKRGWFARLISQKLPGFTYQVSSRDEAGTRALSELRNQGINIVANALAQSTDHILNFIQALRTELAFYIGCLNLLHHLNELQEPNCFPAPAPSGLRKMSFSGLYDVCLALSAGRKVISNVLNADGKDLVVITGANTGGKSTFMRGLGLAQLMMQAGMFVPAETFTAEVRYGIITHFKREEDTTMESGKLDEELGRMSEIVDKLTSKSMVLFNESFAATNEREGSEIAKQITNALVERGIKVIFVTHQYEFAHGLYEKKMKNTVFLRAERLADGTRTFRLVEGEPLQTSYGKDLYDLVFQS
jgi:DNA mismatch repair ATPase MutS